MAMLGADRAEAVPTLVINSVTGTWTSALGGTNVNGVGTNQLNWGTPPSAQSGYRFVGVAPPPTTAIAANTPFDFGTFTHINRPIGIGTSITQAVLQVTFDLTFNDGAGGGDVHIPTFSSTYTFGHFETRNSAAPCADGGANGVGVNANGCADLVTPVINPILSDTFGIGAFNFFLDIEGFDIGANFWTMEDAENHASLRGIFSVSVVPLPAAVWMLVGGIAGLGVVARRRSAA